MKFRIGEKVEVIKTGTIFRVAKITKCWVGIGHGSEILIAEGHLYYPENSQPYEERDLKSLRDKKLERILKYE